MSTTAIRIGHADHGRAMTLEEFWYAEPEEGFRYELARGRLEVFDVPDESHGMLVWFFLAQFADYRKDHPRRIYRYGSAGNFRLWLPGLVSSRTPDLAVVLLNAPKDHRNRRIPYLAMEIVSEGVESHERDYVTKREEYLAYGLLEYWIVDPIVQRITVLLRDGDVWVERVFNGDQVAEGLVLPGFAVRLPELWAAAGDVEDGSEERTY